MNRSSTLNMARRPFVNRRPVVRVTILLWVLSMVFLLADGFLYWSFYHDREQRYTELRSIEAKIEKEQTTGQQLEQRLRGLDLEQQNDQVEFLNRKIGERTFSWSRLFDRLAEILPRRVRLERLSPQSLVKSDRGKRRRQETTDGRVAIGIVGQSGNDESLLELIDALFASPYFTEPNLQQETRDEQGLIRFNLDVIYRPGAAPAPQAAPDSGAAAGSAVPASDVETAPSGKDAEAGKDAKAAKDAKGAEAAGAAESTAEVTE